MDQICFGLELGKVEITSSPTNTRLKKNPFSIKRWFSKQGLELSLDYILLCIFSAGPLSHIELRVGFEAWGQSNFQVNRPLINWEKIGLCHVCHYRAFIAFSITILGEKKLQPPFKVHFMSVFFFWKSCSNFG